MTTSLTLEADLGTWKEKEMGKGKEIPFTYGHIWCICEAYSFIYLFKSSRTTDIYNIYMQGINEHVTYFNVSFSFFCSR